MSTLSDLPASSIYLIQPVYCGLHGLVKVDVGRSLRRPDIFSCGARSEVIPGLPKVFVSIALVWTLATSNLYGKCGAYPRSYLICFVFQAPFFFHFAFDYAAKNFCSILLFYLAFLLQYGVA